MGIQTDLTKVEAIQAMQEGKKVTHRYYIPNDMPVESLCVGSILISILIVSIIDICYIIATN